MKKTNTARPEPPSEPGIRLILDPHHPATIVRIDWRWAAGSENAASHSPSVKQDAESLRALALAMLTAELWHKNPAPVESLGTMTAGIIRERWELRSVNPGKNFLNALGTAYEARSKSESPLGALLKEFPGFDALWKATRSKNGTGKDSFQTKNPDAAGASVRPPLFFRRASSNSDIGEFDQLLALAREIERRAGNSWVSLLSLPEITPYAPDRALFPWLNHIVQICRFVPLRGVQKDDRRQRGDPQRNEDDPDERLELERVFVHLNTTHLLLPKADGETSEGRLEPSGHEDEWVKPLPALRAVAAEENRWMVLHGGPGSGKSTFLRFLMLALANCGLGKTKHWLPKIDGWPAAEATLIPVRIELRLFAAWLEGAKIKGEKPCHVWNYFQAEMEMLHAKYSWRDFSAAMETAVRAGKVIWFLDGLDEVPTSTRKKRVRDCVERFAAEGIAKICRIVVTCRTRAYETVFKDGSNLYLFRSNPRELPPRSVWPAYELAGLEPDQKSWFVEAWYDALGFDSKVKAVAGERKAALKDALLQRDRPEIGEMAKTPLLLTVIAHLHSSQPELRLPDNRAELLHDLVDLFLRRWAERHKGEELGVSETLGDLLSDPGVQGLTPELFLQKLAELAFESFREGKADNPALISSVALRRMLTGLHKDLEMENGWAWADKVVQYILHRAGLVVSQDGESFEFSHRLICEYLAAYHLVRNSSEDNIVALVSADGHWDEVIRLVSGCHVFVEQRIRDAYGFMEELCAPARATPPEGLSEVAWRRVALAADCLNEMGPDKRRFEQRRDKPFVEQLIPLLVSLISAGELPLRDRARAGRILGVLGDPRPGVGLDPVTKLPDIDFILDPLPAGEFKLGERGKTVKIAAPYRIARYPVTFAQFQAFVDQGGYGDPVGPKPSWWSEEGWKWRSRKDEAGNWRVAGPLNYQPVFQTPNHPRVGVSWHEAVAFCAWLTGKRKAAGNLSPEEEIRLAHEAEWEQAARWNAREKRADARAYPWGDDETDLAVRCNMAKTGINHTTAVGLFAAGRSECGVFDLSGNVLEWCENRYDFLSDLRDLRVLRGGSWAFGGPSGLRGAFRFSDGPDGRNGDFGFRCVLVARGGTAK